MAGWIGKPFIRSISTAYPPLGRVEIRWKHIDLLRTNSQRPQSLLSTLAVTGTYITHGRLRPLAR
jgi:hypothetical protein